jgi:hypothetical protein
MADKKRPGDRRQPPGIVSTATGAAGVFLTQAGGELETPSPRGRYKIDGYGFDLFKKGLFDQIFDSLLLKHFISRC